MKILVYSKENCIFCDQAIALLEKHNIDTTKLILGEDYELGDLLLLVPNAKSVPQIFFAEGNDWKPIGGYNALVQYLNSQEV